MLSLLFRLLTASIVADGITTTPSSISLAKSQHDEIFLQSAMNQMREAFNARQREEYEQWLSGSGENIQKIQESFLLMSTVRYHEVEEYLAILHQSFERLLGQPPKSARHARVKASLNQGAAVLDAFKRLEMETVSELYQSIRALGAEQELLSVTQEGLAALPLKTSHQAQDSETWQFQRKTFENSKRDHPSRQSKLETDEREGRPSNMNDPTVGEMFDYSKGTEQAKGGRATSAEVELVPVIASVLQAEFLQRRCLEINQMTGLMDFLNLVNEKRLGRLQDYLAITESQAGMKGCTLAEIILKALYQLETHHRLLCRNIQRDVRAENDALEALLTLQRPDPPTHTVPPS